MSGSQGLYPDPRRQPVHAAVTIAVGLAAVVLAMWGFRDHAALGLGHGGGHAAPAAHGPAPDAGASDADHGEHAGDQGHAEGDTHAVEGPPEDWVDQLYWTLQLFALHGHHLEHAPPQLQAARFLAAFSTLYGLTAFLGRFFRVLRLRLRLFLLRILARLAVRLPVSHNLVVGRGTMVARVAAALRRRGRRVVVVDPTGAGGDDALPVDGLGPSELESVNAHLAQRIFLADDDDGANVERAEAVVHFLAERGGAGSCHFHVFDLELAAALKRMRFSERSRTVRPVLFNAYESTARRVLETHPLDWQWIGSESRHAVVFVVVGFGRVARSLVLQAARVGHFANGKPLRVRVFAQDGEAAARAFRDRYPELHEVVDVAFAPTAPGEADLRRHVWEELLKPDQVAVVALCLPDDESNVVLAHDLLTPDPQEGDERVAALRVSGLVLQRGPALAGIELPSRVHRFRMDDGPFWVDRESAVEQLAKAIHEDYAERRRAEGRDPTDPSIRPWEELDEDLRDSNRQQAAHIPVKLRALKLRVRYAAEQVVEAFTPDEVEVLAKMEHARWCAERYLAGWRFGPRKSVRGRVSPYLVPWERLTEEVREWDREAVRNIPGWVRRSGMVPAR